jgi:hypothetical protein
LTSAVSHIGIGILNNLVLLYMLAAAAGMGVVAQVSEKERTDVAEKGV